MFRRWMYLKKDNKKDPSVNCEHTARLRVADSGKGVKSAKSAKEKFKQKFKRPVKTTPPYRKKYIMLGLVVFIIFVLAYQVVKVRDVNFTALSSNVQKSINGDDYEVGDDQTLRKLYGINSMEFDNFLSYAPKSNMQASEILVIKCKPEYVDDVMKKIQSRIDSQSNSFKNYAPDQYKIIAGSELKKKGEYVYFVSAKNMDQINKAINNSYK